MDANEWRELSIDELRFMWSLSVALERNLGSTHKLSDAREQIEGELLQRGVKIKTEQIRGHYDETPGNEQVRKWMKNRDKSNRNSH